MQKIYFRKHFISLMIVVVLLVISACTAAPTTTLTPEPTATPAATPKPTSVTTTVPTNTAVPTATPAPTIVPTATSTSTSAYTVKTASKAGIGDYLVDSKGMALYYFTKDVIGKSTAVGNTLAAWPLFNPTSFIVPPSLNASDFSTITRADGLKVATYKGWPLYYFIKDLAAGDTTGEASGGVWFLMKIPFYTVMLQTKADIGNYLTDAKGMTLYYFTHDSEGKSTATADILKNWPIFNPANFVVPSSLNTDDFGTLTRDDGQKQATYKDWPLYYYVKDLVSGDTSGQAVNNAWFVINPAQFPPQATTPVPTIAPTVTPAPGPAVTIDLSAQNFQFDKSTITVAVGATVTITFTNKDTVPHNFALYTNATGATPIFVGQTISGPATVTYKFTAPATAGTYFFRCDVHPAAMTGSFVVTP